MSPNLAFSGLLSSQVIRLRPMESRSVVQGSEERLVFSQLSTFLISVFFFFSSPQTQSYIIYSRPASGYAIYIEGNSTFSLSTLSVGARVVYMCTQSTSQTCQNENLNPTGSGWGPRVPYWQPQVQGEATVPGIVLCSQMWGSFGGPKHSVSRLRLWLHS